MLMEAYAGTTVPSVVGWNTCLTRDSKKCTHFNQVLILFFSVMNIYMHSLWMNIRIGGVGGWMDGQTVNGWKERRGWKDGY